MPDWTDGVTVAIGVAGLGIGVGALVYARQAAAWAKRTYHWGLAGESVAEERHLEQERRYLRSIEPRPLITRVLSASETSLALAYANTGGAALQWTVTVETHGNLFTFSQPVSSGYMMPPGGQVRLNPTQALPLEGRRTEVTYVCSFAQDVEDQWWDCMTGERLPGDVDTSQQVQHAVDAYVRAASKPSEGAAAD